jgi:hypothetical protein
VRGTVPNVSSRDYCFPRHIFGRETGRCCTRSHSLFFLFSFCDDRVTQCALADTRWG